MFAPPDDPVKRAAERGRSGAAGKAFVSDIKGAFSEVDPVSLTPRAALDAVYRLRELLAKHS